MSDVFQTDSGTQIKPFEILEVTPNAHKMSITELTKRCLSPPTLAANNPQFKDRASWS